MSEAYIGEIRPITWNYAPRGWAFCNGQLLSIQQNTALFSLLGTTYGGNGVNTFGLPNLQGRVPLHRGNGFTLGQVGGEIGHTLLASEMPAHTHTLQASTADATTGAPAGAALAQPAANVGPVYAAGATPQATQALVTAAMAPQAVANAGGNQPHTNMQPYLVLNFIIALVGIYPSRS